MFHNLRPNSVNSLTEQLGCNTVHSIHRLNPASRYDISELFSISSETFHSAQKKERKKIQKNIETLYGDEARHARTHTHARSHTHKYS